MKQQAIMPPVGLVPRHIRERQRAEEILSACSRYVESRKRIPQEWLTELSELNERVEEIPCTHMTKKNKS